MGLSLNFDSFANTLVSGIKMTPPQRVGILVRVVGMTLEAKGLIAPVGSLCSVESQKHGDVYAEVIGFDDDVLYLMPFSEPVGVHPGSHVRLVSTTAQAEVGHAQLGRVLDGLGRPLDGKPKPLADRLLGLQGLIINPMERGSITETLDVGIKTINGLLTLGQGQRVGLMAGSGVGKSVLLGMMSKYTEADVVVIGLIGERGREVREFIANSLGNQGLEKSIVVASPANESPVLRLRATLLAHLIAEYWRDQGKNVLLLCDSITRVAHAQREIGLAVGEPPTSKGYPPSVFALLPRLIERAGVGKNGYGVHYSNLYGLSGKVMTVPIQSLILHAHPWMVRSCYRGSWQMLPCIQRSTLRVLSVVWQIRLSRVIGSNGPIGFGGFGPFINRIKISFRSGPTNRAPIQRSMKPFRSVLRWSHL